MMGMSSWPIIRAEVAVRTVRASLAEHAVPEKVIFVCFGEEVAAAYRRRLESSV